MGTMPSEQAGRLPLWASMTWPWRIWRWPQQAAEITLGWTLAALERARQRQALARLDDRQLQDMGLPTDRVHAEIRKWFWQG